MKLFDNQNQYLKCPCGSLSFEPDSVKEDEGIRCLECGVFKPFEPEVKPVDQSLIGREQML
jgi:hypothetical protein